MWSFLLTNGLVIIGLSLHGDILRCYYFYSLGTMWITSEMLKLGNSYLLVWVNWYSAIAYAEHYFPSFNTSNSGKSLLSALLPGNCEFNQTWREGVYWQVVCKLSLTKKVYKLESTPPSSTCFRAVPNTMWVKTSILQYLRWCWLTRQPVPGRNNNIFFRLSCAAVAMPPDQDSWI